MWGASMAFNPKRAYRYGSEGTPIAEGFRSTNILLRQLLSGVLAVVPVKAAAALQETLQDLRAQQVDRTVGTRQRIMLF